VAIEVFAADEQADHPVETLRWVRLAEAVLEEEGVRGDAELSMLFVDEQAMADLNKRFLGRDGPTDVLAFPIDDEPVEGGRSPDSGGSGPGFTSEPSDMPTVLGDVVICPAIAYRNAPQHAGTYDDELALLIVHGVLHLLGMDHEDDDEAELMEQRERQLLAKLNRPPGMADSPELDTGTGSHSPPAMTPRPLGPRAGRTPTRRPPGPAGDAPPGDGPWGLRHPDAPPRVDGPGHAGPGEGHRDPGGWGPGQWGGEPPAEGPGDEPSPDDEPPPVEPV
jgi:probable rRNA maturation factor